MMLFNKTDMIEIPKGTEKEDIAARRQIIFDYYQKWKSEHPEMRMYNHSLKEYINIRYVSIDETCAHASKNYLSTLAVLQLDAILTLAVKKSVSLAKSKNKNQKPFEKMITMTYDCPGIGGVKLTVGVRKVTHEKVQYCITAMDVKKSIPKDA